MADLGTHHGGQVSAHEAPPMESGNGREAGTVPSPKGEIMFGIQSAPNQGNGRRLR